MANLRFFALADLAVGAMAALGGVETASPCFRAAFDRGDAWAPDCWRAELDPFAPFAPTAAFFVRAGGFTRDAVVLALLFRVGDLTWIPFVAPPRALVFGPPVTLLFEGWCG